MTIDDMFTEMNLYGFEDFDNDSKLILINEAYFDIVTREAWPFMESMSIITQSNGVDELNTPADFQAVLSLVDTTNKLIVTPERSDVIEKSYMLNTTSGVSTKYYFVGNTAYLYPTPTGDTSYRLFYIKSPTSLTVDSVEADILIPSRHHSIIVYGALVKAFLVNDDPQAATFQNMFETRYQQMRSDVWMKQYDRTERVYIMTDSDNSDSWAY